MLITGTGTKTESFRGPKKKGLEPVANRRLTSCYLVAWVTRNLSRIGSEFQNWNQNNIFIYLLFLSNSKFQLCVKLEPF